MSGRRRERVSWGGMALAGLAAVGAVGAAVLARRLRRAEPIDFAGRTVLVTGGSRGLGLLMARELARQGADLALVARDPDELETARRELEEAGAEVITIASDVGDVEEASDAVERTVEHFGGIDVLINNAGIIQVGPLEHMWLEDFEEAMRVHYWGPLYLTLAALPHMRRQGGGRIVNIASIGGKVAIPHLLPYTASKFALVGLSNGLHAELAKDGIRVTTVCPGLMRTGSHLNALFKGRREAEFTWFALGGAWPLTSIDARRAAHRILEACRHGEPHLILTPQARLLAAAAHLCPGLTARALDLTNRALPGPVQGDGDDAWPGRESASRWAPSILTRLSDRAAEENNEVPAGVGD